MPETTARHRAAAVLLSALVPGILAGTQITGLLFFLNPHLPFDAASVLRGVAFFSLLLGALSIALQLPFTYKKPGRSLHWLSWGITLVLAGAGAGAWTHASYYAYYLPSGINRRLLKAAFLLSLAALICFYTVLIHRVRNRRYGRRSWILFTLLSLASIYVMMERREAFKPRRGPNPRATTFEGNPRPQLVVLGIEAATLDVILPLAEQGRLPFFSRMMAEGSYARLSSLQPVRRKALWTTLATGKYPFQHGIVGERVFDARFLGNRNVLSLLPVGIGFEYWGTWSLSRPIGPEARRVLTLWEILALLDLSTALVGWPLSAAPPGEAPPVEAGPSPRGDQGGTILSDHFFETGPDEDSVWPPGLGERARLFRTRAEEIDPNHTSRFGPRPPAVVFEALIEDLWREDLAFFLLEQNPGIDAFFVALPGLSSISESYFGSYSAVQFEGSRDAETEEAAQLVAAYYMHLDEFVARFWERTREPRLLAVVSVHGMEGSRGWRKAKQILGRQPPREGYSHRGPDGVLMLMGEGMEAGSRLAAAELVDLVPTLLYALGFPTARDLDGAVLTDAFGTAFLARQPLTFLPSYETFAAAEGE